MTITQRIAALTGGVSQRPQSQRDSSQADAQTNALNHPTRGLSKRPPLVHLAKLTSDVTGLDTGFVHPISLSDTETFLALIRNGALSVLDTRTGGLIDVTTLQADSYITPVVDPVILPLDTFTDANLTTLPNHASVALWSVLAGNAATINANKARLSAGTASHRLGFAPPTADYTVSADVTFSADSSDKANVAGRIPIVGFGGYRARINSVPGSMTVGLFRVSTSNVETLLGSEYVHPSGTGGVAQTLAVRFTGNTIEALLNGVSRVSVSDATYAAAGNVGLGGTKGSEVDFDNLQLSHTPLGVSGVPPFKAVQVGKQTVLANTTITVKRGTKSAPNKKFQALVAIRQADYGTQYSLTLDGQRVSLGSPEGVTPQSRIDIDTAVMAEKLKALIDGNNTLDGFTITQFGSTLLVAKTDGSDFTIKTDDGLADNGLLVVKGAVQSFIDLPTKGPDGFTVEVTGDATNEFDNYFVRFDVTDAATNAGVWKECVKPGETIALDAATMPHVLTYKGSFIPASEAEGTPPAPTIVPGGGTLIKERWDESSALNNKLLIDGQGDNVNCTLGDANNIETEYTVYFDVDTRNADPDNLANIILSSEPSAGAGYTERARRTYGPEFLQNNESLSAVLTLPAGARLQLKLNYADGVQPAAGALAEFRTVAFNPTFVVTGAGNKNSTAIYFTKQTGKLVTFNPAQIYPQGAQIRITCDGVNFDYTPLTDVTGAAVATQLKTQIDAHATFVATNPASGQILVTRADATNVVVTSAITWSELTTYHDPDLAMTASGLVGKTVKNLTDGSEGSVTANTATTLTVASLSGGADNRFQKADKIEVLSTGSYFILSQADWAVRDTGDLISNPMPSFVDQKINDVLITKGRLGFVSGGNIVLSEVGNLFNVFRTTVTQLLDGDPIDVKPAHGEAVRFHSYSAWDGRDIFWSRRHQFELSGEPLLSPKTVKLLPISEYPMDAIRPVVLGRFAYFMAKRETYSQVYVYGVMPNQDTPEAAHLTQDVPQFLAGSPIIIAGDEDLGVFAVLTDADRSKLYVHTYDRAARLYAWTLWQFPAGTSIVGLSFLDGVFSILSKRSDGAYLDTLDVASLETFGLLDRKKSFAASLGVFSAGSTTWTLPYSCATNGSEGTIVVVNSTTGAVIASSRPTATTVAAVGDFSAVAVTIGITYTFSHTFSTIFQRVPAQGGGERPITSGRLQLSRLRLSYEDTRNFVVTVTPVGRAARTYTVVKTADTDSVLPVPIACRNKNVTIVITNSQPNACRLTDVEWEGNHYSRSRSV